MQQEESSTKPALAARIQTRAAQKYQKFLDDLVPLTAVRWVVVSIIAIIYCCRVFILQGWYIVTYALGIYILNLLIAFLSPKIDPALAELDSSDDGPELPTRANTEFKPFIRRLPEFKFWHNVTRAFIIAMFCTFFDVFNVPVFWPILVVYFFVLFAITMKRQLKHMIKYKYLPFTHGKRRYQGKEDSGPIIGQ
ncbi:protein RER1-like [Corticium candelabrum]|uniref:protein RER1-like n=1 Tax=Corticium candelabrum TaxID=121492 RepID=UPI002E263D2C|nr:protein RER1-like [Corticium candelabrum]